MDCNGFQLDQKDKPELQEYFKNLLKQHYSCNERIITIIHINLLLTISLKLIYLSNIIKFDYILQINKLLSLTHSHDTDTIIDVKLINDNLQWFSDNLQNINHIFSLVNTVNNNTIINTLIIVRLIKKIYSSWFNSNFIPNAINCFVCFKYLIVLFD